MFPLCRSSGFCLTPESSESTRKVLFEFLLVLLKLLFKSDNGFDKVLPNWGCTGFTFIFYAIEKWFEHACENAIPACAKSAVQDGPLSARFHFVILYCIYIYKKKKKKKKKKQFIRLERAKTLLSYCLIQSGILLVHLLKSCQFTWEQGKTTHNFVRCRWKTSRSVSGLKTWGHASRF